MNGNTFVEPTAAARAWETCDRVTLRGNNERMGPAAATEVALACLGLLLCLRRYGSPASGGLTVIDDRGSENAERTTRLDFAMADAAKGRDLLATVAATLSASPPLTGKAAAVSADAPTNGWRTVLVVGGKPHDLGEEQRASFDRFFGVEWTGAEIRLFAARRQEMGDNWPLKQMLVHWERVTVAIVENLDALVDRLPILTNGEMESLVYSFNQPAKPIVAPRFGFELFDDQVVRAPDATAVTDGGVRVDYRELWERANRLAHYLRKHGVGPEIIVGVFLERSIDLVVAVVGLQKAGAAYLPIDPGYPQGRLEYLVSNSKVGVIITNTRLAVLLPKGDFQNVRIDVEADAIAAMDARPPLHGLKPGNLAAIFYTSGSTGEPKGVMMLHSLHPALNPAKRKPEELRQGEKVLLKSAVGFTLILREIFWPLQVGGHLVVVPQAADKDSAYLVRALRDERVVGANFVPSMLSMIMDEPGFEECRALRLIYTVGESLAVELQRRLFRRLPGVRLFVFYGCTEAPSATFRECRLDEPYGNRIVIGKPLPNKKIYLLDRNMVPVPPGVAGEIHTGGAISRGYLHRPDLTADRFIPNPFSAQPGERLYRTGDLARVLPDGSLEFLGRADFQVQVRGIRIELGEIEAVIAAHPAVNEVVVLADPRHPDQTRLIAYYTEREGNRAAVAELRNLLRKRLPEYMMPASFTRLTAFPLNANGKVDRRNLPPPQVAASASDEAMIPPRTTGEVRLVGLWSRLLGLVDFSVTDRFFDLGGDSLLATKAVAQINRVFGSALTLPDFCKEPTIEAVARLLSGESAGTGLRLFLPISTDGSRRPVFMANMYPSLARYFGPDQPFYGMKGHWLDARFDYEQDIPSMARDYLREMVKIQPTGAYTIFGFSMGGLFALEMARQLEEAGRAVGCLLLLDPTLPDDQGGGPEIPGPSEAIAPVNPIGPARWLTRHRTTLRGMSLAQRAAYIWARRGVALRPCQKPMARLKLVLARCFNALGWDVPFSLRQHMASHYYRRIKQAYRAQPLRSRAKVYLLDRAAPARLASLGRLFPAGCEVQTLATNRHLDVMVEPHLSRWMDDLKNSLADTSVLPVVSPAPIAAVPPEVSVPGANESDNPRQFCVVTNGERQLSVWPADWALPRGWTESGFRGERASCLAHIGQEWTDQRPAALR